MPSARFTALEARLVDLRAHLLPATFEPTGIYPNTEEVGIRALGYRLLAHAELEAYFEDRVLEIAAKAWISWSTLNRASRTAISLMGFSGLSMDAPPSTLVAPQVNQQKDWPQRIKIEEKLSNAVTRFSRNIRQDNHGIREYNVCLMLLSVGVDPVKIDPNLISALDAFGKLRGIAAHTSSVAQVQAGLDPKSELDTVTNLCILLLPIDAELDVVLSQT